MCNKSLTVAFLKGAQSRLGSAKTTPTAGEETATTRKTAGVFYTSLLVAKLKLKLKNGMFCFSRRQPRHNIRPKQPNDRHSGASASVEQKTRTFERHPKQNIWDSRALRRRQDVKVIFNHPRFCRYTVPPEAMPRRSPKLMRERPRFTLHIKDYRKKAPCKEEEEAPICLGLWIQMQPLTWRKTNKRQNDYALNKNRKT